MTEDQFREKVLARLDQADAFQKEVLARFDQLDEKLVCVEAKIDDVAADLKKLRGELTGVIDEDFPALRVVP